MTLTPNLFLSFIVQPYHQDANPAGVCWNVQLCLVFYFISRAGVLSFVKRARAVMGASPHWQFISVDLASKSDFHIEPSVAQS